MPTIGRVIEGRLYECRPNEKGVYFIHWTEGRRSKRHSTGQKSVAGAQEYLDEWCRLTETEVRQSPLTCADVFTAVYASAGDRVRYAWGHLGPHYGHKRLAEITQDDDTRYAAMRQDEGAAASTIRFEMATLRASWKLALARRIIRDVPLLGPLPAPSPPRSRWLSETEADRLLAAAKAHNPRVWLFLMIAMHTGARRTAIQELTWEQVDFETNVIDFLPIGAAQTRKRRAAVPIAKELRAVLLDVRAETGLVIGAGTKINSSLTTVAKHAGVKGVTPHVLRHTAATRMARAGVPLWIIAQVLGNTVEVVEKAYAKYQPDMAREAVEAISRRRAA